MQCVEGKEKQRLITEDMEAVAIAGSPATPRQDVLCSCASSGSSNQIPGRLLMVPALADTGSAQPWGSRVTGQGAEPSSTIRQNRSLSIKRMRAHMSYSTS